MSSTEQLDEQVYDIITDSPATIADIAPLTNVHRETVRRSIRRLMKKGYIEEIGRITSGQLWRPPTVYGPKRTRKTA